MTAKIGNANISKSDLMRQAFRQSWRECQAHPWVLAGLVMGAVVMVLPFWVMLVTSLLSLKEVFQIPPALWAKAPHWDNYLRIWQAFPMAGWFVNSVMVATITTVIHVVISAMAGYAFARFEFPYKTPVFFFFLLTMMVPPQVNIVPLFFVMKQFHWVNTYWALIVPGLFGAFGVFLMRQWFQGFPVELEDAARMDGCTTWQMFIRVALPLATPALTALAIFVFIGSWNSFMWPLIVTSSASMQTLPVGIATLKGSFTDTTDWPLLMTASTVSVIPVVILFMAGQRHFMAGLMSGSLKE